MVCLWLFFKTNHFLTPWFSHLLFVGCPLMLINTILYVFLHNENDIFDANNKYQVQFKVKHGSFKINNIKRGASIIGSAGSGKTESVVYSFLQHFCKHHFSGVIHDYKNL